MKTNKDIIWWLLQKKIALEKSYEEQDANPDIEESIEVKGYLNSKMGIVDELLEFIDEN